MDMRTGAWERGVLCVVILLFVFGSFGSVECLEHGWKGSHVGFFSGTLYGKSADDTFGVLEKNMPLQDGDELLTDNDGFAEIILAGGPVLWLDSFTFIRVTQHLPLALITLHEGRVFVRNPLGKKPDRALTVSTCRGRVRISEGSLVEISLGPDEELVVAVWEGSALVVDGHAHFSVLEGKRLCAGSRGHYSYATDGASIHKTVFESNALERDRLFTAGRTSRYSDVRLHSIASLDRYGDWHYNTSVRSYVWAPRVGSVWRPYLYGRWLYNARGPYWISFDPWGCMPFHYGTWIQDGRGRWCWVPGETFSPGRVVFYRLGNYYAWAPAGCGLSASCYPGLYHHSKQWFVVASKDNVYPVCSTPEIVRQHYMPADQSPVVHKDTVRVEPEAAIPQLGKHMRRIAGRFRDARERRIARREDIRQSGGFRYILEQWRETRQRRVQDRRERLRKHTARRTPSFQVFSRAGSTAKAKKIPTQRHDSILVRKRAHNDDIQEKQACGQLARLLARSRTASVSETPRTLLPVRQYKSGRVAKDRTRTVPRQPATAFGERFGRRRLSAGDGLLNGGRGRIAERPVVQARQERRQARQEHRQLRRLKRRERVISRRENRPLTAGFLRNFSR